MNCPIQESRDGKDRRYERMETVGDTYWRPKYSVSRTQQGLNLLR
jgi:hypothetical protein